MNLSGTRLLERQRGVGCNQELRNKTLQITSFPDFLISRFILLSAFVSLCLIPVVAHAQGAMGFLEQGAAAEQAGDFDKAIANYSEAIRLNPKFMIAYIERGNAYEDQGNHDKAIADYTSAIKIDPGNILAYISRSTAYAAKGMYDPAIEDDTKVINLNPGSGGYYYDRGDHYERKGDHDKAIADFDEAIRIDPKDPFPYYGRGNSFRAKGTYDRASADYTTALQLQPDFSQALREYAWLLATCPWRELRDGKKAAEYATHACEMTHWKDPGCVDTLAAACAEAGDFDSAVKYAQQYLATPGLAEKAAAAAKARLVLYQAHQAYHEEGK